MSTGLVLVHGRSHQLARPLRGDLGRVRAHVDALTRTWMAGLAKGLTLAGRPPIPVDHAHFSFYANAMADGIDRHETGGGQRPDLEITDTQPRAGRADTRPQQTADTLVVEAARHLGFTHDPHAGEPAEGFDALAEELDWADTLRVPIVTSALQFLARKTGTAGWIIEDYLTDVAYYLTLPTIRDTVLEIVRTTITQTLDQHDSIVVISHSLGTIVAYDALTDPDIAGRTTLLVTAGSPLGLPVVQKHLLGGAGAALAVPALAARADPRWVNAFDVRDLVALVHPLAPLFARGAAALRDVTTFNPSGPHSIEDYLSDPDVAVPVFEARH